MISKPKNIEDYILAILQKGSLNTSELLSKITEQRPKTTKQAFYQILRKLKEEEVIILRSKKVSLSHVWIKKMADFFSSAVRSYGFNDQPGEDFLTLSDGEKVSYTFKSPAHTDMFWGHAFSILVDETEQSLPICIYNPHEWFMLARHESERLLFDEIKNKGKQLFLICGNRDALDKYTSNEFDGNLSQYYMSEKPLFEKNNYYLNIFGDYIIEALLDTGVANQIDMFYKETLAFDETARSKLQKIVEGKGKNKLTISRNKRKADKLRVIFKRYFLFKK